MSFFIKSSIVFLLLLKVSLNMAQDARCNVLLIVADDMNGYGFNKTNPIVKTPNLDKFKKTAVTFPQAYCPAPACSPSRTAFLSGVSPHRSGKYYNGSTAWPEPLLTEQENMPEWFNRIGYTSYARGKIFHSEIPKDRVAKSFKGGMGKAGFGPFPDSLHQLPGGQRFWGMQAFPDEKFPDVINADDVIDILQGDEEKPFFMMYGLWRPHSPFTCPQRFFDMYNPSEMKIPVGYNADDVEDLSPLGQAYIESDTHKFSSLTNDESTWKKYLSGYYACYTFADYNIGRVLDALDNSKYADNTIVIITSDNGFHMGEKNRFDKNSLWELSVLSPMAIRVPGSNYAGEICTSPVNLQDLFPTFVDFCGKGKQPEKVIDGHSLKPLLEAPKSEWPYYSTTFFGKGWVSVRGERFRYLSYPDGSEELYDHRNDPWELKNIAKNSKYEDVIEQLRKQVPTQMAESLPGRWTTRIKKLEKKVMEK